MSTIRIKSRSHKNMSVTLAGGQRTIFFNRDGIAECSEADREAVETEMKFRPNRFEIIPQEPPTPVPAALSAPMLPPTSAPVPTLSDEAADTLPNEHDHVFDLEEVPTVAATPFAPPRKRGRPPKNAPKSDLAKSPAAKKAKRKKAVTKSTKPKTA